MAILIQYANGVPGVKFSLDKSEITIGRALDNDISIDDEFVSKYHAVVQIIEDELTSSTHCILIDKDSTNHTFVNNNKVSLHRLDDKDKIFIGQNEFRFSPESISNPENGHAQSGYYDDDAPGLMNERFTKANLTTTRVSEHHSSVIPIDESSAELPTNILTDVPSSTNADEKSAEDKKRFSRRLTLL